MKPTLDLLKELDRRFRPTAKKSQWLDAESAIGSRIHWVLERARHSTLDPEVFTLEILRYLWAWMNGKPLSTVNLEEEFQEWHKTRYGENTEDYYRLPSPAKVKAINKRLKMIRKKEVARRKKVKAK